VVIPIHDVNPTRRPAVVTAVLIIVNLAVYFGIQYPKSDAAEARFDYRWAGVPCELTRQHPLTIESYQSQRCLTGSASPANEIFADKNVWLAVFVSMFLHGSILHVLGNMLFLWVFGNNVEDQLGHVAFLAFYLIGGIVASATHIIGNADSVAPFLGASGAIAAVMGAYIVWFPRARVWSLVPIIFFYGLLPLPAVLVLGLWFLLQFFVQSASGIATLAHIGGFLFGMLVAFLLMRVARFPRPAPVFGGR
jgi:membrane associated rhomboid family serine protease